MRPFSGMNGAVGQDQRDLGVPGLLAALLNPLRDPQVLGLADPGAEQDRVDHRHGRQQRAFAAADEVAGLDLRGADDPVERRRDRAIAEVEGRLFRGRGRGVHLGLGRVPGGEGVVQLLLADRLLRGERLVPGHVVAGLLVPRPGVGEVGLRRREGRLEGLGVDLVERRALRDERPLGELDRLEVALDARANLDVLRSPRLADELDGDGHVLRDDLGDVDLGGRGLGGFLLAGRESEGARRERRGRTGGAAEAATGNTT